LTGEGVGGGEKQILPPPFSSSARREEFLLFSKEMRQIQRILIFFMLVLIIILLTAFGPVFSAEPNRKKIEMKKLLPLEIGSYKADGKDEFYDRNTTFRYMDGAAELYRSFAFKLLMVRHYVKADHPSIVVELFDMGSSEDAFGVFSFETDGEDVWVGQASDYGGGLLRFWQGNFVYAEQEASSTKQDVLEVGKAIASSIKHEGQRPELISCLPAEGLSERSIRYFHLHQSLNYHYFVSHENILHLGKQTDAVLTTYFATEQKGKTFLLLIQYPTKKLAEEALKSFVKVYMPESSASKVIQTENGRWAAAQSHQEFVIVVFDAPLKEKTEELIQATRKNLGTKRSK
jgi:hypothetical protein